MFEAGSLIWRLQAVGAEVFARDVRQADTAVDHLGKSAGTAGKQTELLGRNAEQAGGRIRRMSADSERAYNVVGRTFLGMGVAVAGFVTLSIVKFAQYDKALSGLGAVTNATEADLAAMGDEALDAGRKFGYTAVQAISAEEALAKAGVSTRDILGGSLVGSLTLAAAGQLDVAESAEIAAVAMTQFKRDGKDVPHIADLIAAAAGNAVGDVKDIGAALRQSGLVASQFGLTIEDTTGTLAAFAAAGLIGSDSGTSFKQMLLSLATPSVKQAAIMRDLGISAYDAQGRFVGITKFAGILRDKLSGLTDAQRQNALGWIFGSDAIRAATVLYDEGADGIQSWIDRVNDSGYAAKQAAARVDNLEGDFGKLNATIDKAFIRTGSAANDTLRDMVQIITSLIDGYAELDPSVQGAALAIGVGTAAVLLFSGATLLAVPRIAELRFSLQYLGTSFSKVALLGGSAGIVIAALTALIGKLANRQAEIAAAGDALVDSLDKQTGAFTKYSREIVATQLQQSGAADTAKRFGIDLETLTNAVFGNVDALEELDTKTKQAANTSGIGQLGLDARDLRAQVEGLRGEVEKAPGALQDMQDATAGAGDSASDAAGGYGDLQEEVDGLVSSVQDLTQELNELNGVGLDAREAARALEAAYDDFDAVIAKNGSTLDITTEAGRENQAALDAIAKAALDAGQAVVDSGGSYADYRASLESSRQALLDRINELGLSGDAAAALADQILNIPSATEWEAYVKTDDAALELDKFFRTWNGKTIAVNVNATPGRNYANGGIERPVQYFARGGESHHAMIARGGPIRVWNEPETGGESYIPWAMAKRQRATAVLAETADAFGYQLVPVGAQSFADGGASLSSGRRDTQRRVVGTVRIIDDRTGELDLIEEALR